MKFRIKQSVTATSAVTSGFLALALLLSPGAHAAGFLHASGQDILDQDGNKVLLRGVGLGNWMLPEGYMWHFGDQGDRPRKIEKIVSDLAGPDYAQHFWPEYRKNYITEADIHRIAELGYNSVRPALNSRLFLTEGDNPVYVDEGFQLLDNLVKWSKENGIYVIIDMHAAPGGQTGQNIDDSADNQPELFMDKKYQQRLQNLWVKIAERYKDEPTVAGYDLLNEPLPQRTGAEAKYKQQLEPIYKQLTKAIRAVDQKHMVIVEGSDWANDWSAFTRPFDQNMVYQFHYYCWDQPSVLKGIHQYLTFQNKYNVPVWVGETGEANDAIYWGTTELFEAHNMGWSFWPWKKMGAENNPYSYAPPKDWRAIRDYVDGGNKPSVETAQKAFDELLQNIRLENCQFHADVVNALFHQVPGVVLARNYGHDGPGKSFFVHGSDNSHLYRREEPVPVVNDGPDADDARQVVALGAGEWTAYNVKCTATTGDYETVARIKASDSPAEVEVTIDGEPYNATVSSGWAEVNLGSHPLSAGSHQVKWLVKSGSVQFDWFEMKLKSNSRLSADRDPAAKE